ncbi:MAG: toxin-antitoxin system HicB family antitoxin [Proteobacteria bacterium]|nr:toxin-antitoxin system HicB family antitoxin [Pseudomonadota bacterium]
MASPDKKDFALRLDPALYAALARLANADLRSVNAQIEFLLREALKARGVRVEQANEEQGGES